MIQLKEKKYRRHVPKSFETIEHRRGKGNPPLPPVVSPLCTPLRALHRTFVRQDLFELWRDGARGIIRARLIYQSGQIAKNYWCSLSCMSTGQQFAKPFMILHRQIAQQIAILEKHIIAICLAIWQSATYRQIKLQLPRYCPWCTEYDNAAIWQLGGQWRRLPIFVLALDEHPCCTTCVRKTLKLQCVSVFD